MLLIPAIDIKDGKCVRLRQGLMQDSTVYADDPVVMAEQWVELGARRLHLVDLNGAFAGKPENAQQIEAIVRAFPDLPIQIGGGIRDRATIQAYLDIGISYVILGTRAAREPDWITGLADQYAAHMIIGIDAKDGMVAIDGWATVTDIRAADLAQQFASDGVQAIVYTDISRDGMMQGVNVEATASLAAQIDIGVIASGGVTNLDDLAALAARSETGITGVITGKAIYEGSLDFADGQRLLDKLLN
ncbi:MAG: 1-(5-phosphoribosyl)-5-[(5-phosphoribosylamino)methylideneamino]imidazole-4-carboxamide isomerase [Pseudomonadota bacterium]